MNDSYDSAEMVAEEFSDEHQVSESFSANHSRSSRGGSMVRNSQVRRSNMPEPARGSTVVVQQDRPEGQEVPEGRLSGSFQEGEYDSYGEGESEETITEIVGEEIIELDSDEDVEGQMEQDHEND